MKAMSKVSLPEESKAAERAKRSVQTYDQIPLLSASDLALLSPAAIPHHVAIIPDGNRRWAKGAALSVDCGHIEGAETLLNITRAAKQMGIKILTIYSWSTENWKRSKQEIDPFMQMAGSYLDTYTHEMRKNGIRLKTIGDIRGLPDSLQKIIQYAVDETACSQDLTLILALNYGGRDEITRAVKKIVQKVQNNELSPEEITQQTVSDCLDTAGTEDPDVIIRTSGEQRLSNFLLWQASYTEVVFQESPWPDFSPKNFLHAILEYQKRTRRQGA